MRCMPGNMWWNIWNKWWWLCTAKDVLVSDSEVKEDAISAMEGCPTSAISEEKED